MSQFGMQSMHDRVVALAAQQWNNPLQHAITTNPGGQKNRWVGSEKIYPDIIAWKRDLNRDVAVWIAEVETQDSITSEEAYTQWKKYSNLNTPFYLIVPKGYRAYAKNLANRARITVSGIYEYEL